MLSIPPTTLHWATSSAATRTAILRSSTTRGITRNAKYFGQAVYRHGDHVYRHVWGRQLDWNLEAEYRKIHVHATSDKPNHESHTSELQSLRHLVCRLLLEK